MHICNETEEDVHYTVGDPCDGRKVRPGRFCEESALETGKVVEFEIDADCVARSPKLPSDSVIVSLRNDGDEYVVAVLVEDTF